MANLRNSKQRDAVLKDLQSRYDHPTAEDVYLSVRKAVPSISLATVYRNLKLLESEGLILRITTGDSDRYDGHTHNHYHFTCNTCMKVLDLEIGNQNPDTLPKDFDGIITGHSLMFFGLCSNCKK
jgi:Fur family peroxide stress response transcriptional regulator